MYVFSSIIYHKCAVFFFMEQYLTTYNSLFPERNERQLWVRYCIGQRKITPEDNEKKIFFLVLKINAHSSCDRNFSLFAFEISCIGYKNSQYQSQGDCWVKSYYGQNLNLNLAALNSTEQDKRWYQEAPPGEETVRDGDTECPQHRPAQTAPPALKPRSELKTCSLNYYSAWHAPTVKCFMYALLYDLCFNIFIHS